MDVLAALDEIVGSSGASANHFVRLWGEFVRLHDVHSVHEDTIIFPMAATYFPGCADTSHDEHKKGHSVMDKISALVLDLQVSQPPAVVVDQLKSLVGNLCTVRQWWGVGISVLVFYVCVFQRQTRPVRSRLCINICCSRSYGNGS